MMCVGGNFMKCNVCGGESGKYYLCYKCNKLKDEGKIVKCPDCGEWHYVEKSCKCKQDKNASSETSHNNHCIVCDEKAPNGSLCRDCYYEMRDFKDSFDKNSKIFDINIDPEFKYIFFLYVSLHFSSILILAS